MYSGLMQLKADGRLVTTDAFFVMTDDALA
jgi:hypothetical protein